MAPFGRDEEDEEICWNITSFKGMFEVAEQKPAVNFSISWEMWCACGSEDSRSDEFDMEPDPPCSEFTGKFQERAFSCDVGKGNEGKFGIGPDCCTETKCALTEKEISFDQLMPIPFELLTPADGWSQERCDDGFQNEDDYDTWIGDQDAAEHGGADVPLTPRAQALREFGCSELGEIAERACGRAVSRNNGETGTRSGGHPYPGNGTWNFTKVKTKKERDEILSAGLLCSDAAGVDDTAGGSGERQRNRAEAIMKLCFVLGGAYDTDNDDQPEGGDASNGGSQNDGLEGEGWVDKNKPNFNCRTCECEDNPPPPGQIGDPPIKCTDPPCEDPADWWTN